MQCCFSSVDVHTHLTLSKTFDDILGLVFELDKDGDPKNHDFYGLTRKGVLNVRKCNKRSFEFHDECAQKSYYTSQKHLIDHIDEPIEVHDFFALPYYGLQSVYEKERPTIKDSLTKQSKQHKSYEKTTFDEVQTSENLFKVPNVPDGSHFKNKNCQKKPNNETQYDDEDDIILNNDDAMEDEIQETPDEQQCEGCKKFFKTESFLMHVGRAKKGKAAYGERYNDMQQARKKDAEAKRRGKRTNYLKEYHAKNEDKRKGSNYFKEYHTNNKEKRNETAREWRQSEKMSNLEYQKRVLKFKMETKDGPSYTCQCCQRSLFFRGKV